MTSTTSSTWKSRFRALGPGILMASAAVGGSHLVASTQAGALYGWQLALIIVLTNLFKYPFFRFSAHYTLDSGKSLIEGYAEKNRVYLWIFLIMCFLSSTISTGAVALLTAVIIKISIPGLPLSNNALSVLVVASCVLILLMGRYKALDRLSKIIVISLSITTIAAVAIAVNKGMQMQEGFIEPSPWNLAALGFIIALMGWMPAPIEIAAINSLWVTARQRHEPVSYRDGMFDFDVGYITSAVLAIVFLALGVYVQYGNGETLEIQKGGLYVAQLVGMYTKIDGYSRAVAESVRLVQGREYFRTRELFAWILWTSASGLALILWFNSALAELLKFAMISAFLAAPVFAWLNYWLVKQDKKHKLSPMMNLLAIVGLIYLVGFALLFVLNLLGVLA